MGTETKTALTAQELALYLGCEAITTKPTYKKPILGKLLNIDLWGHPFEAISIHTDHGYYLCSAAECKPILRHLSDMTKEELREVAKISYGNTDYSEVHFQQALETIKQYGIEALEFDQLTPIQVFKLTAYYLSRGFDLFGYIEQGLAIRKS